MDTAGKVVIGVTGGIGSGKTAATDHFQRLGVEVADADVISRQVVLPGTPALDAISRHFGRQILQEDGALDRRALRERIFSDSVEKQWLEKLLHPLIREETIRQLRESKSCYVILASPLLLETDQHQLVDRVLLIDVTPELQIARTSARDKTPPEAVRAIMASQMQRADRRSRADDVIVNDRDLAHLHSEVERLHGLYLELAAQRQT